MFNITVVGDIKIVTGAFGGNALKLGGNGQFVDMGKNLACFNNMDTCTTGLTVNFNLKILHITDGMTIFDNGGNNLKSYGSTMWVSKGFLFLTVTTKTKQWVVKTNQFQVGVFVKINFSWSSSQGLILMFDDKIVASTIKFIHRTIRGIDSGNMTIGKPFGNGKFAQIIIGSWSITKATIATIMATKIKTGELLCFFNHQFKMIDNEMMRTKYQISRESKFSYKKLDLG